MGERLLSEQIKKGNSNMIAGLENIKLEEQKEQILEIPKSRD